MNRNNSIDNIRLLAIFGVLIVHCFPFFFVEGWRPVGIAVNQTMRFGVTCFFALSGYLYAQRVETKGGLACLRKSLPRIVFLYFFWCLFYILPYNISLNSSENPQANFGFAMFHYVSWTFNLENFFLGGSKAHLWFLPALFFATLICTPFLAYRKTALMLLVAVAFYVTGLIAGPYKDLVGGPTLPIGVRNGPFFSTLPFALGAALAYIKQPQSLLRTGYVLTIVGIIGQLTEVSWLLKHGYHVDPAYPLYPDYLLSTMALGVGPAIIGIAGGAAIDNKPWLWGAGRYTLGIYALHFFVMDFFLPIHNMHNTQLWWQFTAAPLHFTLVVLLVMFLARFKRLHPLIS
jgi:surface polysaccharide O-acyltransferase-like enzyme